jgi:hypothetical protein
VAKDRKKFWFVAGCLCFILYFFIAVRSIPPETVLTPRWLSSLESGRPVPVGDAAAANVPAANTPLADTPLTDAEALETGGDPGALFPFILSNRFGYVNLNGRFSINRVKKGAVYLSENLWSEYDAEPADIEIRNSLNEAVLNIEDPRGYPCFLDGRIFLVNEEQNGLSEIDRNGNTLWFYEFAAPLTCIDAAAGLVLTGSVDGVVEVLDGEGKRVFYFEPGGSRYAVILGCAISRDGSRLGIISGIDEQRFLLLERSGGGEYIAVYYEYLEYGFRRPVHTAFIEQDRWFVFEREGGIGVYELRSRLGTKIDLEGEITAIDRAGGQGLFFVINSHSAGRKELVGIRLPGSVVMQTPFKSGDAFLGRAGSRLLVGGGSILASFELEKK